MKSKKPAIIKKIEDISDTKCNSTVPLQGKKKVTLVQYQNTNDTRLYKVMWIHQTSN